MTTPTGRSGNWVAWIALVVAIAALAYTYARNRAVEAELALRPPLAVIDISRIATASQPGDTRDDFNARVVKLRDAVQRLTEAGYVVLERDNVEGYPTAIEVTP